MSKISSKILSMTSDCRRWVGFDPVYQEKYYTTFDFNLDTMNADIYLRECVQKRLIPFIESFDNEKKYPLLAGYGK